MSKTFQEVERAAVPYDAVPLLRTSFDRESLASVRGAIARCGRANGLSDRTLPNFVLAVNEITTNAVRHAGGRGVLSLWRHRNSFWCEVADRGPGISPGHLDQSHCRRAGRIGGHGLWLARQICHPFEIDTDQATGTRVLMGYRLPAASDDFPQEG
jgi:serine/threonine-protein kinase RsbW